VVKFASLSSSTIFVNGFNNLTRNLDARMLISRQMKKSDLANDLATRWGVKTGEAADLLDRAVHRVIQSLKLGRSIRIPGVGTITPGKKWTFRPEKNEP
jgi:hypothetical protein